MMKKQPIKIPPEHKIRRAIRRLARPGIVGVCIWCGHGYRRFDLDIQDAHLKKCAYQKAKQSAS